MKNKKVWFTAVLCAALFTVCRPDLVDDSEPIVTPPNQFLPKRGVPYSFDEGFPEAEMALLAPGINWFYNWAIDISPAISTAAASRNVAYIPMAWNDVDENRLRAWKRDHPEGEYLLAYNEPNLTDQANMTPSQAAAKWPKLRDLARELNLKIVSPAMNYGTLPNYGDPIKWLDEFFSLTDARNDIYAIAIHCYMEYASAMKSYIERFKKYGKPIWMTEFCGWNQPDNAIKSAADQMKFMSEAVIYMELDPYVERYAWFIPRWNTTRETEYPWMHLFTSTNPPALNPLGEVYVNMSACDKTLYAGEGTRIEAEHFSDCNLSEWVGKTGFERSVHFRPTTDSEGVLDIFDFTAGKWVEYQVELAEGKTYNLLLRNTVPVACVINIYIDEDSAGPVSLKKTDTWTTGAFPLQIPAGKHTIRLKVTGGDCALNWLKLE